MYYYRRTHMYTTDKKMCLQQTHTQIHRLHTNTHNCKWPAADHLHTCYLHTYVYTTETHILQTHTIIQRNKNIHRCTQITQIHTFTFTQIQCRAVISASGRVQPFMNHLYLNLHEQALRWSQLHAILLETGDQMTKNISDMVQAAIYNYRSHLLHCPAAQWWGRVPS